MPHKNPFQLIGNPPVGVVFKRTIPANMYCALFRICGGRLLQTAQIATTSIHSEETSLTLARLPFREGTLYLERHVGLAGKGRSQVSESMQYVVTDSEVVPVYLEEPTILAYLRGMLSLDELLYLYDARPVHQSLVLA